MQIAKVYNNSIVLAEANGRSMVVIGTGVGFGAHPGETVDGARVETVFPFTSAELERLNLGILERIDSGELLLVTDLVDRVSDMLGYAFRSSMVFALVDHLAHYEAASAFDDEHPFRWIVKTVYPREYLAARWLLDELGRSPTGWDVPRSGATAIAIHFINNQHADGATGAVGPTEHIHRIIELIERGAGTPIDRTTHRYARFLTHLRFLVNRAQMPSLIHEQTPPEVFEAVYERAAAATLAILGAVCDYVRSALGGELGPAERGYLLLYITELTAPMGGAGD
ncbi:PRD domain-containing protein [Cellulosimicrobium cellulans]|uniref:PRD domain-containing protein n=1 Tax=Cellulosimicrobium cellulans TaxID=1710 RepID=UPI00165284FC|nr:PRD domain-containing protein [Cellulosimicrobium cellulans]